MYRHWEVGKNLGDAEPVRIFGNLYFVGTEPASTHIIDTGEGLIMLDSGYRESLQLVISHMRELGLDVKDLKYIIHTHGHIDHCGATAQLVRMTGAKTYIGKEDRDYVNGKRDLSYATEYEMKLDTFQADVLISDQDEITLGNTKIKCVATPGHTEGCMSYIFDVTDGKTTYTAGLHGGMGVNTMCRDFLDKYGLSYDCRSKFLAAMDRLAEIKVDIFLGNHMQHNDTIEKTIRKKNGDSLAFVKPDEWKAHAEWCKNNLNKMIEKEAEEN